MTTSTNIQKRIQVNTQRNKVSIPTSKGRRLLNKQKARSTVREEKKKSNRRRTRAISQKYIQKHLHEYFKPNLHNAQDERTVSKEPIGPTGDELIDKQKNICRFGFQNIMGATIKDGFNVLPETIAITALQLDFAGMVGSNTVLTSRNQRTATTHLEQFVGPIKFVYSSTPSIR